MSDGRLDRRRFLRGLGATALVGTAGCTTLTPWTDDDDPTIAANSLEAATAASAPTIPETLPVDIEASYLAGIDDDVRATLESVPAPLTATAVPNGVIREDLAHLREHAESQLEEARNAASPYEALGRYRRAGSTATELATAWAAIDEGVTRADVADRASTIGRARTQFERQWSYQGDDPVDAAALHANIEQRVKSTGRILDRGASDRPHEPENALTIGEFAGNLERARTAIEDADYLYRRFTSSLDSEADLGGTLETAAEELSTVIDQRVAELPDVDASDPSNLVDRDISGTPAAEALQDLYHDLNRADYVTEELASGHPASVVLVAVWTLAQFRAFDAIRGRVADGDASAIDTVDDVESIRADAIDALTTARADLEAPTLGNRALARLADDLGYTDRRLTGRDGSVSASFIRYEVGSYVRIAATARGLPQSVERAVAALRTA